MPRHNIWGERRAGRALPAADPMPRLRPITGDAGRSAHVALTVFYNGECPVCVRYIARYQRASAGRSNLIAWSDAAAAPWALKRWHVEPMAALSRMHVADADGRLFAGAAAFARLWRELPGYRGLGLLLALPGVTWLADWVYEAAYVRPLQRRLACESACEGVIGPRPNGPRHA
jgi:predicted DCC family thiol-disulfide oxidoreductase YuxK